jgi:hypothetical protein
MPPVDAGRISRKFVRLATLFGVGVGIGLAPLLGAASVPGFQALLALFPVGVAQTLIPVSALLMGLLAFLAYALAVSKGLPRRTVTRLMLSSVAVAITMLVILLIVYVRVVIRVPYDGNRQVASFVVGLERLASCPCADNSDAGCIEALSFRLTAIESCWGSRPIANNTLVLELLYLGVLGAFGAALGSAVVFESISPRKPRRRRPRPRVADASPG